MTVAESSPRGGRRDLGVRLGPWALMIGLALVLRLPGLTQRPLWYDEAFAVLFSSKGLAAMLQGTLQAQAGVAADVHPLFYYSLLSAWQNWFGMSVLSVRALSVLLGLGVVGVGIGLARSLWGPRGGWAAGFGLAISPFQVHYAQEVRMYVLLALLLLGATWVFWSARAKGGWMRWAAFSVLAASAQYTHNLAVFYLVPLALLPWFGRDRRTGMRALAAGAAAAALYLPWLVYLPSQVARLRLAYWIESPGADEILRTLITFLADRPVPTWPTWGLAIALFCSLVVLLTLAWQLAVQRGGEWSAVRQVASLAWAPPVLLFAASLVTPVFLDRALLPSAAALILAVAALGTSSTTPRIPRRTVIGAVVVASALGLFGFYTYRGFPHAPFEELNARLRLGLVPGEIILHSNKLSALPAAYYAPDLEHRYLADVPGTPSDTLALPTQVVLGMIADPSLPGAMQGRTGVWFIQFRQEREDYLALGLELPPSLAWLQDHFHLESSFLLGDLEVYHFRSRGSD